MSRTTPLLLAAAFLLASCGDSTDPNKPAPTLPLILGLKETFLSPRDIQRVAVTVTPAPGDSIRSAYFRFGGDLFVDSIPIPMVGDEAQVWYVDFTIPIAPLTGTVLVRAGVTTKGTSAVADTSFSIGDDGIPQVSDGHPPATVAPGDTIPILCTGFDRSGILSATAEAHGAADTLVTASDPSYPQSYLLYSGAFVPVTAPVGSTVTVRCTMTDIYGHAEAAVDTVAIVPGQ